MELPENIDSLTEAHKADRKVIIGLICDLCREHGLTHDAEDPYIWGPRSSCVRVYDCGGPEITIDVDGDNPQLDVHVLSWHWQRDGIQRHNGMVFAPDFASSRNEAHMRKCTDVCHGSRELLETLNERFRRLADGSSVVEKDAD